MNAAVAIKAGLGLDCWARGLSVMLETIPGCHLVTKLGSILGKFLQVSIEQLIIEQGMDKQPFAVEYGRSPKWVMHLWLKSLWEKLYLFGIQMQLRRLQLQPPREGDAWLMPIQSY